MIDPTRTSVVPRGESAEINTDTGVGSPATSRFFELVRAGRNPGGAANPGTEPLENAAMEYASATEQAIHGTGTTIPRDYLSVPVDTGTAGLSNVFFESLVDLRWFSTGRLSIITGRLQSEIPATRTTLSGARAFGTTPVDWISLTTEAQARTEAITQHAYLCKVQSSVNRIHSASLKISNYSGLSNALAFSFPEITKQRLTVVNNNGSLDVLVRDYGLSEKTMQDLVQYLEGHFQSLGKTICSLTFNGNQLT